MFKLGLQNYFRIKLNTYNKTQVYIVKKTVSINKHQFKMKIKKLIKKNLFL